VTFLIDKEGKIAEMHTDKDAVDPSAVVTSCERRKMKS
jgi:peroxiredoxin